MQDALRPSQPAQAGHTTHQTMNQGSHAKRPKVKTMPYPARRRRRFVEMETPGRRRIRQHEEVDAAVPPDRQAGHRPHLPATQGLKQPEDLGADIRPRARGRRTGRKECSLTNKIQQVTSGLRPGVRHLCRPTGRVPRPQHFQKGLTRRARTLHDHLDSSVREIRRGTHQAEPAPSRSNICAKTNTLNGARHPCRKTGMGHRGCGAVGRIAITLIG